VHEDLNQEVCSHYYLLKTPYGFKMTTSSFITIPDIDSAAYHTGMRPGEILKLTWRQVDFWEEFIRRRPEDTKTNEGRLVSLNPELVEMFKAMPRGLPDVPVFTRNGKPITGSTIRVGLEIACRRAGIEDFTFHDPRHTFTTNMRRAGVHDLVIMAITGHKTMSMFRRYNSISGEELRAAAEKIGNEWTLSGHSEKSDTINKGLGKA
jgi:integrase